MQYQQFWEPEFLDFYKTATLADIDAVIKETAPLGTYTVGVDKMREVFLNSPYFRQLDKDHCTVLIRSSGEKGVLANFFSAPTFPSKWMVTFHAPKDTARILGWRLISYLHALDKSEGLGLLLIRPTKERKVTILGNTYYHVTDSHELRHLLAELGEPCWHDNLFVNDGQFPALVSYRMPTGIQAAIPNWYLYPLSDVGEVVDEIIKHNPEPMTAK